MKKEMTITELKKSLRSLEKEVLVKLLCSLYKKGGFAERSINALLLGDKYQKKLLQEYQEKLEEQFFPFDAFCGRISISATKKLISEFKSICTIPSFVVSLKLWYVECALESIDTFGGGEEQLYNSLCVTFAEVANKLSSNKELFEELQPRLDVVLDQSQRIGWGVHEYLCEEYYSIPFAWDYDKES